MSFVTMKDFTNYVAEKPFSCNESGCSMKFTNEDHLTVHKKRHDITLNLGLGQKGTTFTDQTPTPTQFIRNCEEVGLFQDLQNVNPFEETFKKAAEAVKSGQTIHLEKSFQSNPPDDTLHTPNIFPHITDVPILSLTTTLRPENIPGDEGLLKQDLTDRKICAVGNSSIHSSILTQPQPENAGTNSTSENPVAQNKVIFNVPEGHFVQLITPDSAPSSCNMVVIKNPVSDVFPTLPITVKDKLKKTLSEKKSGKNLQQKVPILKCPAKKTSSPLSNKFSKFSKNAMKLISKLENSSVPNSQSSETSLKRQKKNDKFQSKESRSEFLARSRAASSRCREKKKLYILYLEKVNGELSTANENLQIINNLLRKEICELHTELLKHKSCSAADKNTEATLLAVTSLINGEADVGTTKSIELAPAEQKPIPTKETLISEPDTSTEGIPPQATVADPNAFSLDVAEIILDDENRDNEIPLNEDNKPPDIIVRFNSAGNSFPTKVPPDPVLDRYIEAAGDDVKQIYSEHSYFFKKSTDIDKRIMSYKTFSESIGSVSPVSSDDCKKLDSLRLKKSDAFRDITSLNTKVLLEPRTPPPLLLLKPFKKRSIDSKHTGKML